ncbi:MAG: 4Fe-4S dicluster-binding protein [Thermodesulfobacteriota bacterium]
MSEDVYLRLAKVLDSLPNGFPATEAGIEQKLLRKVFTPEEADLFCDLKLKFESPADIAARTGRPLEGLDEKLLSMYKNGQLFMVDFGTTRVYKMLPWVFGIFEFQLNRMDREFAELCHAYEPYFGPQFFQGKPQLMHVVPVEKEVSGTHEALPYATVSHIIEKGMSFGVAQCICKQEKNLMDQGCNKPQEVCLGIAPVPGIFENHHWGRPISKEEAYRVLEKSEEAGLVHLSWNIQDGQFFICNCCGCCCGVLRSITELNCAEAVNSAYVAEIDPDACAACGVCRDERCQVNAIEEGEDAYTVIADRCIGCGLCVSTCPSEAISLKKKPDHKITEPPAHEDAWFEERARDRGVDISPFK